MLSFGVNGICDLIFSPCFNCCSSNSIFIVQQYVKNVQYSLIPSNKVCWKDANLELKIKNSNQFNQPKYFFDVSKYLVIFLQKNLQQTVIYIYIYIIIFILTKFSGHFSNKTSLIFYILKSLCIFSILFSIHFLRV